MVIFMQMKSLMGLLQNMVKVTASSLYGFSGYSYGSIPVSDLNK